MFFLVIARIFDKKMSFYEFLKHIKFILTTEMLNGNNF